MKQPQNVLARGLEAGVVLPEEQSRGALQGVKGRQREQPWRKAGPQRGSVESARFGVNRITPELSME